MSERSALVIVDDELIVRSSLRAQLRRLVGQEVAVECAASAAEAWEVIGDLQAEGVSVLLVFSDWLMPETRGDVFLAGLRARLPDIKRVMVTGQADGDVLQTVVLDGVVDRLIHKPWREQDLIQALSLPVPQLTG